MAEQITLNLDDWIETMKCSQRYRYLRNSDKWTDEVCHAITMAPGGEGNKIKLDRTIDAAIAADREAAA